jgi:drug/metabolite transporter (DMT)-like permease
MTTLQPTAAAPAVVATTQTPRSAGPVAMLTLAMVLSGTIGVLVVESGAGPVTVAFARCLIGGAALAVYAAARGHLRDVRITAHDLAWIVLGGIFLVVNWALLFAAYELTSIGIATVAYHVQPFILVLLAAALLRERPAPGALGWIGLGFAGLVLIVQPWGGGAGADPLLGLLLVVGAATLYAASVLIVRRITGQRPEVVVLVQLVVGAAVLAPFADWSGMAGLGTGWTLLVVLGLVHTAAMYVLMYASYPRLGVTTIGVLAFVYPAVAVLVDLVLYDTTLSVGQVAGLGAVLAAGMGNVLTRSRAQTAAARHTSR